MDFGSINLKPIFWIAGIAFLVMLFDTFIGKGNEALSNAVRIAGAVISFGIVFYLLYTTINQVMIVFMGM